MPRQMSNQEIIDRMKKFQDYAKGWGALRCFANPSHPGLVVPEERDGKAVLVCNWPGCGHVEELEGLEYYYSDEMMKLVENWEKERGK